MSRIIYWFFILAFYTLHSNAATLIRDTEIESILRAYIKPIVKAANLPPGSVHLFILQNKAINAFVAGGRNIFINSGLLSSTDHANEIIGVLAHEIGHIYNNDLINGNTIAHNTITRTFLSILLSVPMSVLTNNPAPLLAGTIIGDSVNRTAYLDSMRVIEARADTSAIFFLKKAHYSPIGLLHFMQRLKSLEGQGPAFPFLQDHPLTSDRIIYLKQAVLKSPYYNKKLPDMFNNAQRRIRAKLIAYQENKNVILQYYPINSHDIPALYAHAIMYMKIGKSTQALHIINILNKKKPNDPFFWELKGDILRQKRKLQNARQAYIQAIQIIPWASMILNRLAQTELELNNRILTRKAIFHLKTAILFESWNTETWKLLALAYSKIKKTGLAYYANAKFNFLNNHFQQALFFAKKAQKILPPQSIPFQQTKDLIQEIMHINKYFINKHTVTNE